jgi:hypothetical protein
MIDQYLNLKTDEGYNKAGELFTELLQSELEIDPHEAWSILQKLQTKDVDDFKHYELLIRKCLIQPDLVGSAYQILDEVLDRFEADIETIDLALDVLLEMKNNSNVNGFLLFNAYYGIISACLELNDENLGEQIMLLFNEMLELNKIQIDMERLAELFNELTSKLKVAVGTYNLMIIKYLHLNNTNYTEKALEVVRKAQELNIANDKTTELNQIISKQQQNDVMQEEQEILGIEQ